MPTKIRPLILSFAIFATGSVAFAQQISTPFPGVVVHKYASSATTVVDLCTPGVSIRATKFGERTATAQQWAQRGDVDAEVAINGDFYDSVSPLIGSGKRYTIGPARGAGEQWPPGTNLTEKGRFYWQFGPKIASVEPDSAAIPASVTEVVGAHNVLYKDGKRLNEAGFAFPTNDPTVQGAHRRTATAINVGRTKFVLFASDVALSGRALVDALIDQATKAGAGPLEIVMLQDGGGSSQMYVKGQGAIIPATRQVANHIGVFAKRGNNAMPHCPNQPAVGILEKVTCDEISGWATDTDIQPTPTEAHFYFGGPAGTPGAFGIPIKANLPGACAPFGPCNLTFKFVPPAQAFDNVERPVHAYAIDDKGMYNREMIGSPKMLKCAPRPGMPATPPTDGGFLDSGTPLPSDGVMPGDPNRPSTAGETGADAGITNGITSGEPDADAGCNSTRSRPSSLFGVMVAIAMLLRRRR